MENLPLLLQFSVLLIPNQSCFPVILTEHFVLTGRRSNLPEYAESPLPLTQVMSATDPLPHQTASRVDLQITPAGIRHAITGSFGTNRKVSPLTRNNKVHGIISTSHGACQQGAEVGEKQTVSASEHPSLHRRWLQWEAWCCTAGWLSIKQPLPKLFHAEDSNAYSLFVKDPAD